MIHYDLNLFYETYNTIDQHYQRQIHFLLLILLELKSPSIIPSVSMPIIVSMLSVFVCIVRVLSEALKKKLLPLLIEFSIHLDYSNYLSNHVNMV